MDNSISKYNARINPNVLWVVESDGLLVFSADSDLKIVLKYPEAALWDFIARELPADRIKKMMSPILGVDNWAVQDWIINTFTDWFKNGLINKGEGLAESVDDS